MTVEQPATLLLDAAGYEPPLSYAWTKDFVTKSLQSADVAALSALVINALTEQQVVLPDSVNLVRRCVVALLSGHLVLQGPPGTGKTTLARILAKAFDAQLRVATATSDWSPYDVVGGLRPDARGQLVPGLGCITESVLACAGAVRAEGTPQAEWLLIDELNRADIDKAIGGLYTVLSSVSVDHLTATPIELWFGQGEAARIWVPARFRIIGTMNDIDTSFVNALSQGLSRRFQFLYVGVPGEDDLENEAAQSSLQARAWLEAQYGEVPVAKADDLIAGTIELRQRITDVVRCLRQPSTVPGWPVGTAQLVDLWRTILLQAPSGADSNLDNILDTAIADRIVPQMSTLDKDQLDAFEEMFTSRKPPLHAAAAAVRHLVNPHTPL